MCAAFERKDDTHVGTAGDMLDFCSDLISSWSRCVFSLVTFLRVAIAVLFLR
jgi:hypothetical protein